MARSDSLEILAGIVDRLDEMGTVTRGAPLRSGDWNTMVEAVGDLARLMVSREETLLDQLEEGFAPRDHEHRGQATLAWFDAPTRERLEGGTGADVRTALQKAERERADLRAELDALRQELRAQRLSLGQLRDADFARDRQIGRVSTDVESLRGIERGVDGLAARLTDIDDGIAGVLAFRDQLETSGGAVDLRTLQDRVGELEEIRDNLRLADGNILQAREIEAAIVRLSETVVVRDDVDALITTRIADGDLLSDDLFDTVTIRVEDRLGDRFAAAEAGIDILRGDLTALGARVEPLDARIGAVDDRVASQGSRLDGLSGVGRRLDTVETRLGTAESGIVSLTLVTDRVAPLERSVDRLGRRTDGLAATERLAAANADRLGALTARTDTLEERTGELDGVRVRIDALEQRGAAIDRLTARVGTVEAGVAAVDRRVGVAEAELFLLEGTAGRLDALESSTADLADWRVGADRQLGQLATGGGSALNLRIERLEDQLADTRSSVNGLSTQFAALNLQPGGGVVLTPRPVP